MIGIIFDLDGTLLNTLEDLGNSVNAVLKKRGLDEHPMDAYRHFVGNGVIKLVERALPRGYDDIEGAYSDFMAIYRSNLTTCSLPYDGVIELLTALKLKGIKIAISTNKAQDLTDVIVSKFFADFDFVDVIGDRFDDLKKPNPHYPLLIKEKMDVETVYFVGDSDVDMVCAIRAGMIPVGVAWGFRGEVELLEAGASFIMKKASDLLEYMKI